MAAPTWAWIVTVSFDWATPTVEDIDRIEAGLADVDGSAGRSPWNVRAEDPPWKLDVPMWVDHVDDPAAAVAVAYARITAAVGAGHHVLSIEVVDEAVLAARVEV